MFEDVRSAWDAYSLARVDPGRRSGTSWAKRSARPDPPTRRAKHARLDRPHDPRRVERMGRVGFVQPGTATTCSTAGFSFSIWHASGFALANLNIRQCPGPAGLRVGWQTRPGPGQRLDAAVRPSVTRRRCRRSRACCRRERTGETRAKVFARSRERGDAAAPSRRCA